MSLDGQAHLITRDIGTPDGPPGFDCECRGWVYDRMNSKTGFAKCSRGAVHCLNCRKRARRFRSGFTCSCHI